MNDKTFRAGEPLELATVNKKEVTFTYPEDDNYVFMDTETYEEMRVKKDDDWAKYLKEGANVNVVMYNGQCITVELPPSVDLIITDSEPGIKGNSQGSNVQKPATLETGYECRVPLFINAGDKIKINTETGDYISRVNDK